MYRVFSYIPVDINIPSWVVLCRRCPHCCHFLGIFLSMGIYRGFSSYIPIYMDVCWVCKNILGIFICTGIYHHVPGVFVYTRIYINIPSWVCALSKMPTLLPLFGYIFIYGYILGLLLAYTRIWIYAGYIKIYWVY